MIFYKNKQGSQLYIPNHLNALHGTVPLITTLIYRQNENNYIHKSEA